MVFNTTYRAELKSFLQILGDRPEILGLPWTGWLKQQDFIFHSLKTGNSNIKVPTSFLYSEPFHAVSCKRDICCVFSTCQLGNQGLCSGLRLPAHTLWCTMPSQLASFVPQWR